MSYDQSQEITEKINTGDLSEKPGWVRWSLHPTMTNEEVHKVLYAIREVSIHHAEWIKDYIYLSKKNEFIHKSHQKSSLEDEIMSDWFSL